MSEGALEEMKKKIVKIFQTYEEPVVDESGNVIKKIVENPLPVEKENDESEDSEEDVRLEIPLPEGVLKVNLGIPIIVVCNKSDLMMMGPRSKLLMENIDFI